MEGLEERRVKKQPKWLFFPPTTKARRAPRPSPVNKNSAKDYVLAFFFCRGFETEKGKHLTSVDAQGLKSLFFLFLKSEKPIVRQHKSHPITHNSLPPIPSKIRSKIF